MVSDSRTVKRIQTSKSSFLTQPILTVVIPTRDVARPLIRNCIRSLEIQSLELFTTIIVDYGSSTNKFNELMKDIENFDCTVYRYSTDEVWSLSIARNIGIRRATGEIIATVDADLILEPDVLSTIVEQHKKTKNAFIVSTVCNLHESMNLNEIHLPEDYTKLRNCKPRPGRGGVTSASREWWHKVRAFDERMRGWGAEDNDIWKRAGTDDRNLLDIQTFGLPYTKVYHQWHPFPILIKTKQLSEKKFRELRRTNKKIWKYDETVIRNDENWGRWYKEMDS